MPHLKDAPTDFVGILKQLGPGLIISASIVGSGELIVTTKLGADVGFTLLWFIIFGCLIKVFLQVELGRYAILSGKTMLQAIDGVPGPRLLVSWLVWVWICMFVATFFQVSGMVGGIAQAVSLSGLQFSNTTLALAITGSCALLLFIGRYTFVERFSTVMVAGFTLFTILAVLSLYWTDYGVSAADLAEGMSFGLTDDFTIAFAAFGVIGVGASELIYYPYWCLEKGYARFVGRDDQSDAWQKRAKGWVRVLQWDAFASMVIYTGATIAFYLLGAAVLHGKSVEVSNDNLMASLSHLYSESFGVVGLWIFIFGAIAVLYSTVFIATASNGRLAADLLQLFGLAKTASEERRGQLIRYSCVALPVIYCVFYLTLGRPVTLVTIGAVAQALMLPFLGYAALYFLYRRTAEAMKPGKVWFAFLWISSMLMGAVGIYQLTRMF
ncbi:Nramp family divalent metal transporter [Pelagicoccus enzymogenes]|uniref:Nramp family divalent metal transporter n=1 Tax=Pelagicoccus enzymogenes TaxID=2773457 RepID=UPI00280DD7C8|nr:Nramp family divalent metal transporter [Pelagicoccus enzymogenes]MDQ8197389.1 Nramp family divalent metal transporter [Pelagicoccus enzymogenes]